MNHVILHQTMSGGKPTQMEQAGEVEVVIGYFGGGSNFGGLALRVLNRLAGKGPRSSPWNHPPAQPDQGAGGHDYQRLRRLTPLIKMYTLGHDFVPPGVHAGGSHITAPRRCSAICSISVRSRLNRILNCLCSAALKFARTEGILPAPESSHAIRATSGRSASPARGAAAYHPVLPERAGHFDRVHASYLTRKIAGLCVPLADVAQALAEI